MSGINIEILKSIISDQVIVKGITSICQTKFGNLVSAVCQFFSNAKISKEKKAKPVSDAF